MYILSLIILCFVFLYCSWPNMMTRAVKDRDGAGEERAGWLIYVAVIWLILFWVVLVLSNSQHSWTDSVPVITAVGVTAGIFFTYSRLLAPSFYGAYLKVSNWESGGFEKHPKLDELTIEKGKWWPIFLAVYNTSISAWDNYRITFDMPDGFEMSETAAGFPSSPQWDYAPKQNSLNIGTGARYVQKHSTNVLAIGETSATRFFVKANNGGKFRLKIMVTVVGRLNQRVQSLRINVS